METTYRKALLSAKCPACWQGDIFRHPLDLSNLSRFAAMHRECPVCKASFEPEPGFYFGSMFITYAVNVVIVVLCGVLLFYLWRLPEWVFLTLVGAVAMVTLPFSFRLSRTLWLYWFGGLKHPTHPNS